MEKKSLMFAVMACVIAAGFAQADVASETILMRPYIPMADFPSRTPLRNDYNGTLSLVFQPTRDVPIMKLGFYDHGDNGLIASHHVGIYYSTDGAATGTLVAEVTIPAGDGAELAGGFRWVDLETPVVLNGGLESNEWYFLSAAVVWGDGDDWWEAIGSWSADPVWWTGASGFNHAVDRTYYGGNYGVDQPATWRAIDHGSYYAANMATMAGTTTSAITVAKGETAALTVGANGATTYTWSRDGVELVDGGKISGQGTGTLTVTDVQVVDEGDYSCVVSDGTYTDEVSIQLMTKRLVGWWKMDDATDSVQEVEPDAPAHHGSVDDPNFVGGYDGEGSAMVFSGSLDPNEIMILDDSSGYFGFAGQGATVNAWVKMPFSEVDSVNNPQWNFQAVITNQHWPGYGWGLYLQNHWNLNTLQHAYDMWLPDPGDPVGEQNLYDDQWHMITFVIDPANAQMISYIDGVATAKVLNEAHIRDTAASSRMTAIGGQYEGDGLVINSLLGAIDEVRVWSYPLEAAEISALMPVVNFVIHPQSQTRGPANGKAHAELSAAATNASGYQWYKDGGDRVADLADDTLVADDGAYSGATTDTLIITDVTLADEGGYFCVGLNAGSGDVASNIGYVEYGRLKGQWAFEGDLDDATGVYHAAWSSGDDSGAAYGDGVDGGSALDLSNIADPNYCVLPVEILTPSFSEVSVSLWSKATLQTTACTFWASNAGVRVIAGFTPWTDSVYWDAGNPVTGHNRINGLVDFAELGNIWNHFVFTIDTEDDYMAVYRNGELFLSWDDTLDHELFGAEVFVIGAEIWADGEAYNRYRGLIDDFRVYNYALNAVEAAHLYTDVTGETICLESVGPFDVTGPEGVPNCTVDLFDLAAFAADWMRCNQVPDCLPRP